MDFELIPRLDTLVAFALEAARSVGRADTQLAPIWAEELRHTYGRVLEHKYPDLPVAEGELLPIDTSVDPAALEWEYYMVDHRGVAVWIDDEGHMLGNSASTASRHTGKMHEMGHEWEMNIFDLERHAKARTDIPAAKPRIARRAHMAKTQWTWLFGDTDKDLIGLLNHPNIQVLRAALNAGTSSRLFANKTNDEIAKDFEALISAVPRATRRNHHAAELYMSFDMNRELKARRLGAGDGFASLYDLLVDRYKGDDSGQGKVVFKILNECGATWRENPETLSDTSGLSGDFMFVLPPKDKELFCFIEARPFTQLPPEQERFVIRNVSHSKIGGCKLVEPLAICRMDFGTT